MQVNFSAINIKGSYTGSQEKAVSALREVTQNLQKSHKGVFADVNVVADTTTFNLTATPQVRPGLTEKRQTKAFDITIDTAYNSKDLENAAASFVRGQLSQKKGFTIVG